MGIVVKELLNDTLLIAVIEWCFAEISICPEVAQNVIIAFIKFQKWNMNRS